MPDNFGITRSRFITNVAGAHEVSCFPWRAPLQMVGSPTAGDFSEISPIFRPVPGLSDLPGWSENLPVP